MYKSHVAAALLLAMTGICQAQEIEWKQTLNIPKGQNISRDRADMLGIEFGDTYAEAKAKLQKLGSEGIQPKAPGGNAMERMRMEHRMQAAGAAPTLRLSEDQKVFQFQAPGHSQIMTASYIGKLKLTRRLPGSGSATIEETIIVHLTSPASGHQVVAMERYINYPEADQPQLSDIIGQMQAKFNAEPHIHLNTFKFQFDGGQDVKPVPSKSLNLCTPAITALDDFNAVRQVNKSGDCDVVMVLDVTRGISQNHASALRFYFGDNERIKANGTADYAYVDGYIKSLQSRTRGAPPKL